MSNAKSIGGAPTLAVICFAVVVGIFSCSGGDQGDGKSANTQQIQAPSPVQERALDFARPIVTKSEAIVCSQDLLIAAGSSRAAHGPVEKILDAFHAVLNRSEKVKAAGCEEWKAGIPLFHVHPMTPSSDLIGFGVSAEGMSEYFTMKSQLANATTLPVAHVSRVPPNWPELNDLATTAAPMTREPASPEVRATGASEAPDGPDSKDPASASNAEKN